MLVERGGRMTFPASRRGSWRPQSADLGARPAAMAAEPADETQAATSAWLLSLSFADGAAAAAGTGRSLSDETGDCSTHIAVGRRCRVAPEPDRPPAAPSTGGCRRLATHCSRTARGSELALCNECRPCPPAGVLTLTSSKPLASRTGAKGRTPRYSSRRASGVWARSDAPCHRSLLARAGCADSTACDTAHIVLLHARQS
jgi:hypothetical protein